MKKANSQNHGVIAGECHAMKDDVCLTWLGQAGFLIEWKRLRILMDPYLSDCLARKYKGTDRPHERLMKAPVMPEELRGVDFVLCSHRHSDHMDPETLPVIAGNNPACRFVVPAAVLEHALGMGLPRDSIVPVNAGDRIDLAHNAELRVVPSAHEELMTDRDGRHCFLGYILKLGCSVIYHSGDCAPYAGLANELGGMGIDLALLPINGRDAHRRQKGIPGNFFFEEAIDICKSLKIACVMVHHFGMFALNTVDEPELRKKAALLQPPPQCVVPEIGALYVFDREKKRLVRVSETIAGSQISPP